MGLDKMMADEMGGDEGHKASEESGRKHGEAAAKGYREGVSKGLRVSSAGREVSPFSASNGLDERSAHDAGKKSADAFGGSFENNLRQRLRAASGSLAKIEIDGDTKPLDAALARVRAGLATVGNTKINIEADADQVLAALAQAEAAIKSISGSGVPIDVEVNLGRAYAEIKAFREFVEKSKAELSVKLEPRNAGHLAEQIAAALKAAQATMGDINVDADTTPALARVAELKARLTALSGEQVGVTITAAQAFAEIESIRLALLDLDSKDVDIQVRVDSVRAAAQLAAVLATLDTLTKDAVEIGVKLEPRNEGAFAAKVTAALKAAYASIGDIEVHADTAPAIAEVAALKAKLAALGDEKIGVTITAAQVLAEILVIQKRLLELDHQDVDVQVRADVAKALVDLSVVEAYVKKLDHERAEVKVDIDRTAGSRLQSLFSALRGGKGDTDSAGNSFRAFNGYLLAAVTVGPALIPIIGALAGGLLALGPLLIGAGLGLGVFIGALARIPNVVTQINNVQKNAAKDAITSGKQIRSATNSVRDAQQGLADSAKSAARARVSAARSIGDAEQSAARARESAAQSIADAADRQRKAELDLAQAQKDAVKTQANLTQARVDAARKLKDLSDQMAGGKLAERQAVIDVFNATVTDQATRQDGSATNLNKEQSSINLASAQLRLKQIREQNLALAKEQADNSKKGIEGDAGVVVAKEQVTAANTKIADAQAAVSKAAIDSARTQKDAARSVADADQATARARESAAQSISDANEGVAKSQQRLIDAQANLTDAINKTGEYGSAAINNLNDALAKLSPAGQRFAYFIAGLQKTFLKPLEGSIQTGFLPSLQRTLESLITKYGPSFIAFAGTMARTLGGLFERAGKALEGPQWSAFFGMLSKYAPIFTEQFAVIMGSVAEGFAILMTAMAPFSKELGDAIVGLAVGFARFMTEWTKSKGFESFISYLRKTGPEVFDLFVHFLEAMLNLFIALTPFADRILKILDGFLQWIASMDPDSLSKIAIGIIILLAAFQAALGIGFVASAIAAVIASEVGVIVFAIIALVAVVVGAFIGFYETNDTFRKAVDAAWNGVQTIISKTLDFITKDLIPGIKTAWDIIATVSVWLWKNVLQPVFEGIGRDFGKLVSFFRTIWDAVGYPVFRLIAAIIVAVAKRFSGETGAMGNAWGGLAKGFKFVYDHVLKPVFDAFGRAFGALKPLFDGIVAGLGKAWAGLQDLFRVPILWIVDTVINGGLIGSFNKVADFFKTPHINPIDVSSLKGTPGPAAEVRRGRGGIAGLAEGGPVGGWSPHSKADNILTRLTANEFVQPVARVKQYGIGFMEAVRRGVFPTELARGFSGGMGPAPRGSHLADGGQPGIGGFSVSDLLGGPLRYLEDIVGRLMGGLTTAANSPFGAALRKMPLEMAKSLADGISGAISGAASSAAGIVSNYTGPSTGRVWPTNTRQLSPSYPGHSGVDIAARMGAPIYAPEAGLISYTGTGRGYGQAVFETFANGLTAVFGHTSEYVVRAGRVAAGQLIAKVGSTGHSTAPHLHFEINKAGPFGSASNRPPSLDYLNSTSGTPGAGGRGGRGGIRAGLYDSGGALPPGWNLVLNNSGRNEQVLTGDQWEKLLDRANFGGGGSGLPPVNVYASTTSTGAEIADELSWAINTMRTTGARR